MGGSDAFISRHLFVYGEFLISPPPSAARRTISFASQQPDSESREKIGRCSSHATNVSREMKLASPSHKQHTSAHTHKQCSCSAVHTSILVHTVSSIRVDTCRYERTSMVFLISGHVPNAFIQYVCISSALLMFLWERFSSTFVL